jgi:hypothetical protein
MYLLPAATVWPHVSAQNSTCRGLLCLQSCCRDFGRERFVFGVACGVVDPAIVQTSVLYARYTTPSRFITERDFVNLTHWVVDPDGTLFVSAVSIEHPGAPVVNGTSTFLVVARGPISSSSSPLSLRGCAEDVGPFSWASLLVTMVPVVPAACACPLWAGAVRADVKLGGWVLKPNAAGTSCMATYLMSTDLCGSIPTPIVKVRAKQLYRPSSSSSSPLHTPHSGRLGVAVLLTPVRFLLLVYRGMQKATAVQGKLVLTIRKVWAVFVTRVLGWK